MNEEQRISGTVKWFSEEKGYGFIKSEGRPDVFVHWSGIRGSGRRNLEKNGTVDYILTESPKRPGELVAGDVVTTAI